MEKNGIFSQRIRLRHLHTFVAIAQQGSLARAAQTLNLSQPALSKTLNELEQLTGTRLFERGRLGAQLTLTGEQFLTHAIKVLDALNHAGQALNRSANDVADIVRIGALPSAALGVLPALIGQFQQQQNAVALQVGIMNNTMLLAGLKTGELDLAIGRMADAELMYGLNYELLFLESLIMVVRPHHPLLRDNITLSRAMTWPVVVSPQGTGTRHHVDTFLANEGSRLPGNCIETLSASLSRQLTVDYNYVWFVPSGAVKEDLRQGILTMLPITIPGIGDPIGILTRVDSQLSAKTQLLLAAIRKSRPG